MATYALRAKEFELLIPSLKLEQKQLLKYQSLFSIFWFLLDGVWMEK